jgi:hypothetical protein
MRVFTRRFARAMTVAAGLSAPLLWTASAFAADNGEVPDPLSTGPTILIFVVIPVGVSLVILLLTKMPGWFRAPRYRPTREWDHDPLWFAGPANAHDALANATDIRVRGGGASAGW